MSALLLTLLLGSNMEVVGPLAPLTDGGVGIQVTCDNCSSAAGPGGGLSNAELRATPVPVSGSLTCSVASTTITGSVATTGTYWQATQPVSLASVPTHGVTGTFWQATQPVSIAGTVTTAPGAAGTPFHCLFAAASTTTLLELSGCAVNAQSRYITSIFITGGIATAATVPALIRSGTGTNCGTGTVTWFTCWHAAAGSCTITFPTPIKVTAGHALCGIDATAGTKSMAVTGYVAP
jgi:hypothetical protein